MAYPMERQDRVWDREYGGRGTRWARRNRELPGHLEGSLVLEAGAGNGKTLWNILERRPAHVVAMDFSRQALRRLREELDPSSQVSALRADLRCMPFRDGAFDSVVLHYVLDNMLAPERRTAVSEASRVLRHGGRIVFEDFAAGDFRQETGKRTSEPEPNTILKKKGLICHYFGTAELTGLFEGFDGVEAKVRETRPIRNKTLLRKTVSLTARKR